MALNLRTQILLFLFLFAFTPLLLAVLINLPLVLERVESFYRHAFLQDLRADFRDLDQHLASRDEMLRLLAKLPEPGVLLATAQAIDESGIDRARTGYVEWINRILRDQLDINQILFIDRDGVPRFWLERSFDGGEWQATAQPPPLPDSGLVARVLLLEQPLVVPTPIRIDPAAAHPSREMAVQLLAPIAGAGDAVNLGVVVMTVDIGGLVRRDPATLWVHGDGRYLNLSGTPQRAESAFVDFPGLEQQFDGGRIALWESAGRHVIWVPLFRTSDGQALWVGRNVDRGPLHEFETALVIRVLSIIVLLVAAIWFAARAIARRAERLGQRVLAAVRRMLEDEEAVHFDWRGSRELRQLGAGLTQLAETHARDRRNLRAHARELEESARYKSEFLANVSHELRTPLNSILLLSKLLVTELDDADDESRRKAAVIREASEDLRELIDDVLDLSRIEAGRLEFVTEDVDLPRLLEDLIDLMTPQFTARGLTLDFEPAPDAPTRLRTDPARLRQVIKNFLSNAVKFTHQGGVSIRLTRAAAPYAIRIDVADTGIGIASDKQALVFEAFRQVDGSTGRHYGGTGLGLTISRELVKRLGGEIALDSTPGHGSTFSALLPAERPADAADIAATATPAIAPEMPTDSGSTPPLDACRVLLIGGSVRDHLRISGLLHRLGLDIAIADDAAEAQEVMQEQTVDVVLIDVPHLGDGDRDRILRMLEQRDGPGPGCIALLAESAGADATIPAAMEAVQSQAELEQALLRRCGQSGDGR